VEVTTEGDTLYYEVRGAGRPLLMIPGGLGDAGFFAQSAALLSERYQVITFDRRGNSRSTRRDPQNFEVAQQARDALAVLGAAGHCSGLVFGTSAGAVIALEMARRHPSAIEAAVIHEPPVVRVTPDAETLCTAFAEVYRTAWADGPQQGMAAFAALAFGDDAIPARALAPADDGLAQRLAGNFEFFVRWEMLPLSMYEPDIQAIRDNGVAIVMAASRLTLDGNKFYGTTASVLAGQLGCRLAILPGHHLSYLDQPAEWSLALDAAFQEV